jgi:L-ascorbate metabolism protein UlaG (beta-lactamase superfamily)
MYLPLLFVVISLCLAVTVRAQNELESDVLSTSAGDLQITFIGHGTLMFTFKGKVIHVDPYGQLTDYSALPKADLILVTHDHSDHLDQDAIRALRTPNTTVVLTAACTNKVEGGVVMKNGDKREAAGVGIQAVPAYNVAHRRADGQAFHPRGSGNGYILTFGDRRVYVAGDTENTPEMKALTGIDVAFLPMNLPYTMTPEMVADAARAFRPKILYPYHRGQTDPSRLKDLLKDTPDIEVRIRRLE